MRVWAIALYSLFTECWCLIRLGGSDLSFWMLLVLLFDLLARGHPECCECEDSGLGSGLGWIHTLAVSFFQ